MARVNRFKQHRSCIGKNLLSTLRIWKLEVFRSQMKNVGIPQILRSAKSPETYIVLSTISRSINIVIVIIIIAKLKGCSGAIYQNSGKKYLNVVGRFISQKISYKL